MDDLRQRGRRCILGDRPVLNSDIVLSLDKLADLIELEGGNPVRIGVCNATSKTAECASTAGLFGAIPDRIPAQAALD